MVNYRRPYYTGTTAPTDRRFWFRVWIIYSAGEVLLGLVAYQAHKTACFFCNRPVESFIVSSLLDIMLTTSICYLLYRLPWKNNLLQILSNAIVFILYFFCWIGLNFLKERSGVFNPITETGSATFRKLIYVSWYDIGKYVLKIAAFYMLVYYTSFKKAAAKRLELSMINKDLQLNLLKAQLSPHFYFNTLNNLYGLSINNSPKLREALQQLANILRYVLNDCNQPQVLLRQEINFLKSYIALEKLRYEDETLIDLTITGEPGDRTIMPLVLVQFVENAFKHGMKEKSEKNWMCVEMEIREADLLFRVKNSSKTINPSNGVGLNSVKHRLGLVYEGRHLLNINQEKEVYALELRLQLNQQ